jgi:hypothetical protein
MFPVLGLLDEASRLKPKPFVTSKPTIFTFNLHDIQDKLQKAALKQWNSTLCLLLIKAYRGRL